MSAITSSAAAVGEPATAGVGWSTSTRSSTDGAGSASWPDRRVPRCTTLRSGTIEGASGTSSAVHHFPSMAPIMSTTAACSRRSLSEAIRRLAMTASTSGSPDRGRVPASGWDTTEPPVRRTSSSGDAPTNPSTQNVVQEG